MEVPQHETVSRTHAIPISDLRSHKFQDQKHKATEELSAEHIPLLLLQPTDGPLAKIVQKHLAQMKTGMKPGETVARMNCIVLCMCKKARVRQSKLSPCLSCCIILSFLCQFHAVTTICTCSKIYYLNHYQTSLNF